MSTPLLRLTAVAGCAILAAACSSGSGTSAASSSTPVATTSAATTSAASGSPGGTSTVPPAPTQVPGGTQVTLAAGDGAAGGQSVGVPAGWTASVWASVQGARMETWTPEGDLLVSTDRAGRIVRLHPGAAGTAPAQTTVLDGLDRPQGVAVAGSGANEVLIVGEQTRISVWNYRDGQATGQRVLVANLPAGGLHYGKFVLVVGQDVYYAVGSASDSDPADRTGTPPRAIIAAVPLAGGTPRTVAVGVRNGEGLSVAPDGTVFTAVNQVNSPPNPFHGPFAGATDAYGQTSREWALDHPVDQITRITDGADLGWPYCQPDTSAGSLTNVPFVADPVTNPDGKALNCATLTATQAGLPAHSAPIGFHFLTGSSLPAQYRNGAVVAAHGSYQRQPPRAPMVWWLPWDAATRTLGTPQPLMTGFQLPDGSRWGRPADAVPGPDGALYVSDDMAGAIYKLTPS